MRLGEGVEWALHCCTILAVVPPGKAVPANRLAEFHDVPPAYLAKHLQALSRAGIVTSVAGPRGGYRLARPPDEITMLEVIDAVEGAEPAFACTEIRQRGPAATDDPAAYRKPCGIARAMAAADAAWREQLRTRTIGHLLRGMAGDISPEAATKGVEWFQEVLR